MRITALLFAAVFPTCVMAEEEGTKIGDWALVEAENAKVALTATDNGAIFGYACLKSGNCNYFLDAKAGCESGTTSPMLATGEAGVMHINGTCSKLESGRYLLDINEDMSALIAGSSYLGIAFAQQAGNFRSLRFSLNGAIQTIGKLPKMQQAPADAAFPEPSDTVF